MIEYATMSENGKSGWNRSAGNQPTAGRGAKGGVRSAKKVLCALCLVLFAVLGICIWLFSGGDGAPKREAAKDRGLIKEVTPAPAPKAKPKKTKEIVRNDMIRKIEEKYGTNIPPNLKAPLHYLRNPPQQVFERHTPYSFLTHSSERAIASVLMAEPGAFFVIQPEYGEDFNQDFVNAMLDKIEIEDGDSEETRKIKQFVTDAKKEIAALVKAEGKKPNELMNEHAAAMFELGRYQRDLEDELNRVRNNPDLSDADVADFFAAANKLRKERGLEERPIPNLTKRGLQLQKRAARAARRAAKEAGKGESPAK